MKKHKDNKSDEKPKKKSGNKKIYNIEAFKRLIENMDIEAILKDVEPAIIRYSKNTNLDFDEVLQNCRITIWTVISKGRIRTDAEVDEKNGEMKKGINPRNYITYACINSIRDMLRIRKKENKLLDAIRERQGNITKNKIFRDVHGDLTETTEWAREFMEFDEFGDE